MEELFNGTVVTTIDDTDRIALGVPGQTGAKNILFSAFKTLISGIAWGFTQAITVGTPTSGGHATTKTYVDGLDNANVKLTGTQTISGVKTFSGGAKCNVLASDNTDIANKLYVDSVTEHMADVTAANEYAETQVFLTGFYLGSPDDLIMRSYSVGSEDMTSADVELSDRNCIAEITFIKESDNSLQYYSCIYDSVNEVVSEINKVSVADIQNNGGAGDISVYSNSNKLVIRDNTSADYKTLKAYIKTV